MITVQDIALTTRFGEKAALLGDYTRQGKPYVWMLKLSSTDYSELEKCIKESIESHKGDYSHLLSKDYALYLVIYFAEWHKWVYRGKETGDDAPILSLTYDERKALWEASGIDSHTFVYNASENPDKPNMRWMDSLRLLGGLAIQHELRKDDDSFLLSLCRQYNDEEIDFDELEDRTRAVAFQKSIKEKHSLYYYIAAILTKRPPFAPEDLADKQSDVNRFIEKIITADRKAKQDKFDFEWLITYSAYSQQMTRRLRVQLKPEPMQSGKLKQYISYWRMRENWGIEQPDKVHRMMFDLRFKDGGTVVREASFRDPLLTYSNTGSEEAGFLCAGNIDHADFNNVPVTRFTRVDIVMWVDGATKTVQQIECNDYLQVYKVPQMQNEWSSRKRPQSMTSLIFSSRYTLKDEIQKTQVVTLPFRQGERLSEPMHWLPIYDVVTLVDEHGVDVVPSFYNRNGFYQVVTKRYMNTIKYEDNLYATYKFVELEPDESIDEIDDNDFVTEKLPVLFGREGLQVRYYPNTRSQDWQPCESYELEYRNDDTHGRYIDWKDAEPRQGKLTLRITINGMMITYRVYYVPFISSDTTPDPIWRDFVNRKICFAVDHKEAIEDEFVKDNQRSEDTLRVDLGQIDKKLLIDVYRPFLLKELYQNGQLISYHDRNDNIQSPLIVAEQFAIRDFNEQGVKEYDCHKLGNGYYAFPDFRANNPSDATYLAKHQAKDINKDISVDNLQVYISRTGVEGVDLYAWDYKNMPETTQDAESATIDSGVVFQSLKDNACPRHYACPVIKTNNSGWAFSTDDGAEQMDDLTCFLTAAEHKTYFFIFEPIRKLVYSGKMIDGILIPLLQMTQGELSEKDVDNLYRFAREFHFDWMLEPRERWTDAVIDATDSEEEQEQLKTWVIEFFRKSPKITDDSERRCLNEFLLNYWRFDSYSTNDAIAVKALRYILGDTDRVLGRNETWEDFLKRYDECRYKFSEMTRILCKKDSNR